MDNCNQCYYNNFHFHYRHPWSQHALINSLEIMNRIDQEDRVTIRRKLASQFGFTGLSILHRLHCLYHFDVLKDLVFDSMHTLILRVVHRHLQYYMDEGFLKDSVLDQRLSAMPWIAGLSKYSYAYIMYLYVCIVERWKGF